jgi:hypothetical protein
MNLIKLAVGIKNTDDLRLRQELKRQKYGYNTHITRLFPKRHIEIKNGGSMYWVINGFISARQKIKDIKKVEHDDGIKYCHIILDLKLIDTQVIRYRPFQGWRYLTVEKAPKDLSINNKEISGELIKILKELCII